jgi:hypothetical protein
VAAGAAWHRQDFAVVVLVFEPAVALVREVLRVAVARPPLRGLRHDSNVWCLGTQGASRFDP